MEVSYKKAVEFYEQQNFKEAIIIFKELAKNGCSDSCEFLSIIYRGGEDGFILKSKIKASYWDKKYCDIVFQKVQLGDKDFKLRLGKMYQYGDHIEQNDKKAIEIYHELAKEGNADAQFHLSCLYWYGWCGLKQDSEKSGYWLNKAVENKHPEALYNQGLGLIAISERDKSMGYLKDEGISYIKESAALEFWVAQDYIKRVNS